MKKLILKVFLLLICAMTTIISCKNKGKAEASTEIKDSLTAVIDSIIEENDTTPMPMFLFDSKGGYLQMYYWTDMLEEPTKNEDNADYFETFHQSWALQDMFRRHKDQYTNLIVDNAIVPLKYVDEVLKDPDGNTPSVGELHGREDIPALGARFAYVNSKDKDKRGAVVVTDAYLKSRKLLPIKHFGYEWGKEAPLPAAIVKQLEQKYSLKASRSILMCEIDGRYIYGSLQFKGEYKIPPTDENDNQKKALALDVLIEKASGKTDKIYVNEQIGYLFAEGDYSWNADDEGRYVGCLLLAVFEGPHGLEICYNRSAPESTTRGMFFLRDGKLIENEYAGYHVMIDEDIPVWKKDFEEMKKLYLAEDPHENKNIQLTKWAHCYVDYENEWIWLRDKNDKNGAIFIRKDDKIELIAVETPRMTPSRSAKNGITYLKVSGSAGGPSMYYQIWAFKNGKQIEKATILEIYGEVSECTVNGKELSKEQGQEYLNSIPAGEKIVGYFKDIE